MRSAKQWDSVIEVSLHGFFNVTRPLLLPMQVISINGGMA